MKRLRELLNDEIDVHLRRISKRLMDPKTNLSWNVTTNNCQRLVDVLTRGKDFEYIFPRLPKGFGSREADAESQHFNWPRYLISFGNRLEGPQSAVQQPNSIVASFCNRKSDQCDLIDVIELIQYRSSKRDEDTANEFASWQELRLAPSTPGDVGNTIADPNNTMFDKLWELPRDSMSVIQFHLLRPSHRYQDCRGKMLGHLEWIDNRLRLLRQLQVFSAFAGGFGAALLAMFHQKPHLLSRIQIPRSQVFGSIRADERVKTVRPTPLNAFYVILNRRSPRHSLFYDAQDEFSLPGILGRLVSSVYPITLPSPRTRPLVYTGSYVETTNWLIIPLTKRRLYGKRDWYQLAIGNSTVVLIENFKKTKTLR